MMESLPVEMLWHIAQYLKTRDLVACCAVSRRWRDVFSQDIWWQSRCDPSLEEYLRTTPCTVEPCFVSPEGEGSTLSPVGHWRLAFMRENHLWNNWLQGRYTSGRMKISYDSKYGFLGNDNVLVINGDNSIDLWNMFTMEKKRSQLKCLPNTDYLSVSSNYGILIRYSGVQVVFINEETKDLEIKFLFFYEESEKDSTIEIFEDKHRDKDWQQHSRFQDCFKKCLFVFVGSVFVGRLPEDTNLHIWDLETGIKLKEENCSYNEDYTIRFIKNSPVSELIVIILRPRNEEDRAVYTVYSLTELTFLPFRAIREDYYSTGCEIYKHYIALTDDKDTDDTERTLSVYNCFSTDLIYCLPIDDCSRLSFIDNSFIFTYRGSTRSFNPTNKKISKIFKMRFCRVVGCKFLVLTEDVDVEDTDDEDADVDEEYLVWLLNRSSTFKKLQIYDGCDLASDVYNSANVINMLNHTFTRLYCCKYNCSFNKPSYLYMDYFLKFINVYCFW